MLSRLIVYPLPLIHLGFINPCRFKHILQQKCFHWQPSMPLKQKSNQEASGLPSTALAHLICLSSCSLLAWLRPPDSFLTITREFLLQFKPCSLLFYPTTDKLNLPTPGLFNLKVLAKLGEKAHLYLFHPWILPYRCQTSAVSVRTLLPQNQAHWLHQTLWALPINKSILYSFPSKLGKNVSYDINLLTQAASLFRRSFSWILYIVGTVSWLLPDQLLRKAKLKTTVRQKMCLIFLCSLLYTGTYRNSPHSCPPTLIHWFSAKTTSNP